MYGRLQRRFNQSVHTDPYRLFILLSHVCFRQLELARATVAQNAETTLPAREQVLTPPHLSTRHPPMTPTRFITNVNCTRLMFRVGLYK